MTQTPPLPAKAQPDPIPQVTEKRLELENFVHETAALYRMIVEDMPALICRFQPDGTLTFVNKAYCDYFNKQRDELVGQDFFQFIPEAEREIVRAHYASLTSESPVITYEHRVLAPDGTYRWQRWTDRAIFDEQGQALEYQSIGEDISDRKEMEEALQESNRNLEQAVEDLRTTQEKIILQERLAAVGQLAAGIAHDFNNTLMPITLYGEMLLRESELSPQNRARVGIILDQARHASLLTQQILDFSRRSIMRLQPLELTSFLRDLMTLFKRTLPENIHLDLQYEPGSYWISADPARMEQVFLNLALNARDAMPEGGELYFEISALQVAPDEPPPFRDMSPGDWIQVNVKDTGTGISPSHLPNIFEPFFTTKKGGQGSGLGLAQAYGIVKKHGGYIDTKTQVGEGTTFILYFSAQPDAAEFETDSETPTLEEGHSSSILVVEDDQMTRQAIGDSLEMLNHRVRLAESGQQAIEIYKHEKIDLVLSDLVMPKIGGVALFAALQEIDPGVKMVVLTGYPLEENGRELLDQGILAWVQKPLTMKKLSQTVEDALH